MHSLILKDRKLCASSFDTDRNKREECPINDWIDKRSTSFTWNEGAHYQAYVSKLKSLFTAL